MSVRNVLCVCMYNVLRVCACGCCVCVCVCVCVWERRHSAHSLSVNNL